MRTKTPKTESDVMFALEQVLKDQRLPGEFTAKEFKEDAESKGIEMTIDQAKTRLRKMVEVDKILKTRKVVLDSKMTNLYSKAKK